MLKVTGKSQVNDALACASDAFDKTRANIY